MTTLGTRLGSVSWVDERHAHAYGFRLVGDESTKLSKTPAVQSPLLAFADLDTLANVRQILQDHGATRLDACHDTLA